MSAASLGPEDELCEAAGGWLRTGRARCLSRRWQGPGWAGSLQLQAWGLGVKPLAPFSGATVCCRPRHPPGFGAIRSVPGRRFLPGAVAPAGRMVQEAAGRCGVQGRICSRSHWGSPGTEMPSAGTSVEMVRSSTSAGSPGCTVGLKDVVLSTGKAPSHSAVAAEAAEDGTASVDGAEVLPGWKGRGELPVLLRALSSPQSTGGCCRLQPGPG